MILLFLWTVQRCGWRPALVAVVVPSPASSHQPYPPHLFTIPRFRHLSRTVMPSPPVGVRPACPPRPAAAAAVVAEAAVVAAKFPVAPPGRATARPRQTAVDSCRWRPGLAAVGDCVVAWLCVRAECVDGGLRGRGGAGEECELLSGCLFASPWLPSHDRRTLPSFLSHLSFPPP